MKKTLLAAAMTLALGTGSAVAGLVKIDRNGPDAGGVIGSTSIQWNQGNLLFKGMVNATAGGLVLYGHHTLSSFNPSGDNASSLGGEWSLVYQIPLTVSTVSLGAGGVLYMITASAAGGTMGIFYDCITALCTAAVSGSNTLANAVTGAGYGDGRPIVTGSVLANVTPNSTTSTVPAAAQALDAGPNLVNDSPGITSNDVSGSITLRFEISAFDSAFFPDGLDVADPLVVDLTFGPTGTGAPIQLTEPSDIVGDISASALGTTIAASLGATPNYGDSINDNDCAVTGDPCDLHTAGSGAMGFGGNFFLPEPGSVALLGLGLGVLGMVGKRRRSSVA